MILLYETPKLLLDSFEFCISGIKVNYFRTEIISRI